MGVPPSIPSATCRTRTIGPVPPRTVRPGDLIDDAGTEATVQRIDVHPTWPQPPTLWVITSITADGAELVTKRGEKELVTLLDRPSLLIDASDKPSADRQYGWHLLAPLTDRAIRPSRGGAQ